MVILYKPSHKSHLVVIDTQVALTSSLAHATFHPVHSLKGLATTCGLLWISTGICQVSANHNSHNSAVI